MKQILFLSQVFPKVKCYCYDNDKTLYDVLEGSIDTEELHGYFQQLEHQHADQNTGDLTNTTVGGYTADGTSCDCLQLVALSCVYGCAAGLCCVHEASPVGVPVLLPVCR